MRLVRDRAAMRLVVVAVGVLWATFPLTLRDRPAEDALVFHAAGQLLGDRPEVVYPSGGRREVTPEFQAVVCERYDDPAKCEQSGTAFLSPPSAIPIVEPLGALSAESTELLFRAVGSAAAVAALAVAWRRLADPGAVAGFALATTPIVAYTVGLGQTSTLLLAAGIAGPPGAAALALAATAAWGLLAALKAFPAVAAVFVPERWRAHVAVAAALLVAGAAGLALAGTGRLAEFVDAVTSVADRADSGSFSSLARDLLDDGVAATAATLAMTATVVAALAIGALRSGDAGVRWAAGLVAAVAVSQQVWPHYLLAVAALGVAVARHRATSWLAVAGATATIPAVALLFVGGRAVTVGVTATLAASAAGLAYLELSRPATAPSPGRRRPLAPASARSRRGPPAG